MDQELGELGLEPALSPTLEKWATLSCFKWLDVDILRGKGVSHPGVPQTLLHSLPDSPSRSPFLGPGPEGPLPFTLIPPPPGSTGPIVPCRLFH